MITLKRNDVRLLLAALRAAGIRGKSRVPVLNYVLAGGGRLVATDLDVLVSVEAETGDGGLVLVAMDALCQAAGDRVDTLVAEPGCVTGAIPYPFVALDADSFPDPAQPPKSVPQTHVVDMEADSFVRACRSVLHCRAQVEWQRPVIMHPWVRLAGGRLAAAATDGARLALYEVPVGAATELEFSMPFPVVGALGALQKDRPQDRLRLALHARTEEETGPRGKTRQVMRDGWVVVQSPTWRVAARHEWWMSCPDYRQVLPRDADQLVATARLDGLLARAAEATRKAGDLLRLTFAGGEMRAEMVQAKRVVHRCVARTDGLADKLEMLLDPKLLAPCLAEALHHGEPTLFPTHAQTIGDKVYYNALAIRSGNLLQLVLKMRG